MEYREPGHDEFRDLASRILYEDNHVLVFNKRPGEIVQGDKTGDECLADTLKAFIAMRDSKPGKVFLGVPHRLDRPVSGIVVFAKTSKALSRLSDMFRRGEIHKTYWALCCNRPKSSSGELADWLSRNEKQNKSYIVREGTKDAKLARLAFRHIGDTENYSLLEVNLLTGRHHQIRVQLAHHGMPIWGDARYGGGRPGQQIALWGAHLGLVHPTLKTPMHFDALPPRDAMPWSSFGGEVWRAESQILL